MQIGIIYFGLYYQAGKEDSFVQSAGMMYSVFTLITVVSIQFIAFFVIRMRMEWMKKTAVRYPFLFKIVSCCRVKNREAFIAEHRIGQLLGDEMTLGQVHDKKDK